MSCCSKPAEKSSSCCSSTAPEGAAAGACATEGGKCCIQKMKCMGKCLGALVLRLTLAATMLPFGLEKINNWDKYHGMFTQYLKIPAPLATIAICAEVVLPIMLILGLFTRVAAMGLAIQMIVATVMVHLANGFFGTKEALDQHMSNGYWPLTLYAGCALALALIGPGKISLDAVLCCWKKKGCCSKSACGTK